MSGEIPEYLKKNFDPNSLSIPQLRSILKDHGLVNVPAPNQPKRVFIKLFNNEILKNRDEILKKLNLTENSKNKKTGRPKKIVENVKSDLPQALRGKSESPLSKDIKNKRVSFGGNDYKIEYESPSKKTTDKIKDDITNKKQEEKVPLIQSTIKRLNEEKELNNLFTKSYDSEQSGITQGRVKRARQQFNNENKQQDIEIKKIEEEEPSSKKRKQNEKLNAKAAVNTSPGNIFQKFDTGKTNQSSTSSRIPKANVVFAEENDDEEDDEDYVYQSNSPSYSSSEDDAINDEEMEDIEHDYATSSNINFSSTVGDNEESNQEQNPPESSSASGTSILQLDNISYSQAMNEGSPLNKISKLEKPKISPSKEPASFSYNNNSNLYNKLEKQRPKTSHSFSYNPNNSFNRSNRIEKPKYSQSFSYNNNYNSFNKSNRLGKPEYSPSNNKKSSSYSRKKVPSPYNTSFNDKPKINISYDMSPIQSNHNSLIYDDNSLNHSSSYDRSHTNSNIIGNLYETISEDEDSNLMEIASQECSGCSLINISAGIMAFILTTLIGLFVQWYVSTGGFAGYCEPGKTLVSEYTYLNSLPEDSVLRYNPFYRILPKCLECPKNAICKDNHVIGCKNKEDKLQRKLIASIVPETYLVFPLNEMTCQFDYEKKRNYDRLLQNTRSFMYISNNIVRKKLGQIECNEMNKTNFDDFPLEETNNEKKGITETELKNLLYKEIGGQIREERFKILWVNMYAKLVKYSDEVDLKNLCVPERRKKWKTTETKDDTYFCEILKIFRYVPHAGKDVMVKTINGTEYSEKEGLLTTTEKPVYSNKCRMKWFMNRYIRSNVYRIIHRYWKYALSMVGLTILAGIVDLLIKKRNRRINVVNSICEEVIWLLQEAEYQNKEDPLHFPSPNISVAQLYDILLPAIIGPKDKNVPEGDCVEIINNDGSTTHYWVFHNPKERALIWKRVYDQVRTNSNVLESNALVKRESHRCWEWIGNPTLYIRRKSPNTKNKQTTYYPKVANNSRLSLGGVSNRSFNTQQQQQFAGDISAISSSGPNANESYESLLENENDNDEVKNASLKGHINKLSIFNDRRQSQIHDDHESEELNEIKERQQPSFTSTHSSLYPNL